jgi:selenide, water dikinase
MGPGDLAQVLAPLRHFWGDYSDENLLVGLAGADDAAIYRLSDDRALIQTVDFFTPIVDDPRAYGAIAAANSMSDVYAMGGEVLLALNIGAFPNELPRDMIAEILLGAAETVREGGGVMVGGHTVNDAEPKFGLAVTGIVHPDMILTLAGALPGDVLVLTKPLGGGLVTTAARADALEDDSHLVEAVRVMMTLNRGAAAAMRGIGVHACTDITGFGLFGHAAEMAEASDVRLRIQMSRLPALPGALRYAELGQTTGGARRNRDHFGAVRVAPEVETPLVELGWDPQTSGGLLIAVAPDRVDALLAALEDEGATGHRIGIVEAGEGLLAVTD